MKKALFLPIFAIMAMVSQVYGAWALCTGSYAGYCKWDECNSINRGAGDTLNCANEYQKCFDYGYLYTDPECTEWSGKGNDPSFTVVYCKWPTGCEKVMTQDERDNCKKNSTVYSDKGCTNYLEGRDPSATALGCCKWDNAEENPDGKCWTIWSTDTNATTKVSDCKKGKNTFWSGACPTTPSGICPNTPPVYPTSSSSGNSSSSSSSSAGTGSTFAYCVMPNGFCATGPFTLAECVNEMNGTATNNCSNSSSSAIAGTSSSSTTTGASSSSSATAGGSSSSTGGNTSSSSGTSGSTFAHCIVGETCADGPFTIAQCMNEMQGIPSNSCTTPIIVLPKPVYSNSLSAMRNAVNLQITSNAAIQIFDLKGNAVRSLKFAQGNYIVPLSDLPRGLYIVKASNASWKQTIKVTVR